MMHYSEKRERSGLLLWQKLGVEQLFPQEPVRVLHDRTDVASVNLCVVVTMYQGSPQ